MNYTSKVVDKSWSYKQQIKTIFMKRSKINTSIIMDRPKLLMGCIEVIQL